LRARKLMSTQIKHVNEIIQALNYLLKTDTPPQFYRPQVVFQAAVFPVDFIYFNLNHPWARLVAHSKTIVIVCDVSIYAAQPACGAESFRSRL